MPTAQTLSLNGHRLLGFASTVMARVAFVLTYLQQSVTQLRHGASYFGKAIASIGRHLC